VFPDRAEACEVDDEGLDDPWDEVQSEPGGEAAGEWDLRWVAESRRS
jgi:hypothetical protein